MMKYPVAVLGIAALLLSGSGPSVAAEVEASAALAPDYGEASNWLCRPENVGFCAINLDATVVKANGHLASDPWQAPKRQPAIDCFYLYPTASLDNASNSDLKPGDQPGEEIHTVRREFARFAQACRPFAPIYRSTTITQMIGAAPPGNRELAYADARAAWRHYLAHDNGGRGVVLIGQSQGAFIFKRLIQEEIEGRPAQKLLVSALLPGTDIAVPLGRDIGGDFKSIPLCRKIGQTGCVITYNSFRANAPPTSQSFLGRKRSGGLRNACINPAALAGGKAPLDAYLETRYTIGEAMIDQAPWTTTGKPVVTRFVKVPHLLSGECRSDEHGDYLAITVRGNPQDARVDDIPGDVFINGKRADQWGLHVVDMELVMGDLVHLISVQAKAWQAR